jgi:hypothetical protein
LITLYWNGLVFEFYKMSVNASMCTTDCTATCCNVEQAGSNIQAL